MSKNCKTWNMANWIPINKVTRIEYPAVDDAGKAHYEADPMTAGKYTFRKTADAPAIQKAKKEKETLTPIGVLPPENTDIA